MRSTMLAASLILITATSTKADSVAGPYAESLHHSSTAAEGELNGWGQFFRGLGQGLHDVARAEVAHQQAVTAFLENRQRALSPRIERRQRLERELAERRSMNRQLQAIRQAEAAEQAEAMLDEVAAEKGQMHWPHALQAKAFGASADIIEHCVAYVVTDRQPLTSVDRNRMSRAIRRMQLLLRERRGQLNGSDYADANRFLVSLRALVAPVATSEHRAADVQLTSYNAAE